MEQHQKESGINNFLIDGFPRSRNNLDGWEKEMAPKVNLVFVLLLDVSEEICIKRCLERGSNADPANRRSDDNMESLKKRIVTYNNDTIPIIQYFANLNKVERIDASKIPEQVSYNNSKKRQRYYYLDIIRLGLLLISKIYYLTGFC